MAEPHKVGEILDRLEDLARERDHLKVADVFESFGARTFGPAIMVPALLELTPFGAIPGVPSALALLIALVAMQKMLGRQQLWIPRWIGDRPIPCEKLLKSVGKLRGIAHFLDRHFHGRMKRLTHTPFSQIAAGIVIMLCATVPFLEFLPFASSGPMLAIAMFGLAVLVQDGALMIVALAISMAAMGLGFGYMGSGSEGG